MNSKPYVFDVSANDALPLEYKLRNREPLRQVDVSDFIDDSAFVRVHSTDERGFEEESRHIFGTEVRVAD